MNRNKPTHETVVLPREGRKGPAPDPMVDLTEEASGLWARLWATPEATQWGEADVPGLTRYVELAADEDAREDPKLAKLMLDLEDRYCLNSYSRRVNRWVRAEAAEEEKRPRRPREAHLRAVDASG